MFGDLLFLYLETFLNFLAFQVMSIKLYKKSVKYSFTTINDANPHTHIEHLISTTNKESLFPLQSYACNYLQKESAYANVTNRNTNIKIKILTIRSCNSCNM